MLAQILWLGHEIAEVTCPTAYFDEASSINLRRSVRYGFGCLGDRRSSSGWRAGACARRRAFRRAAVEARARLRRRGPRVCWSPPPSPGSVHGEFLAFDDDVYVTANPLVLGGLRARRGARRRSASSTRGNWHPLTWLSHMLDVSLFGVAPAGHHATSVALHAANAVLAFLALAELTGTTWRAALAAALFAVHPLRVESVAWIAERKDVLVGVLRPRGAVGVGAFARGGSRAGYGASLALFAAVAAARSRCS